MKMIHFLLLGLSCVSAVSSCAIPINQITPPDGYQGAIAGHPVIQVGDFWIYEQGDSTKAKSTTLVWNLHFPLWLGKSWRYDVGTRRPNHPPGSKDAPVPAWVECYVAGLRDVEVSAGKFSGYQCDCQCYVVGGERFYQEGCGTWTVWYSPEVKNVVRVKADNPVNTLELLQYKIAPLTK